MAPDRPHAAMAGKRHAISNTGFSWKKTQKLEQNEVLNRERRSAAYKEMDLGVGPWGPLPPQTIYKFYFTTAMFVHHTNLCVL